MPTSGLVIAQRVARTISTDLTTDQIKTYIQDAIDDVGNSIISLRSVTYDSGADTLSIDLNNQLQNILALNISLKILTLKKTEADVNNFKMSKGRLSLDNTNQASDLQTTIDNLSLDLKKAITRYLFSNNKYIRIE